MKVYLSGGMKSGWQQMIPYIDGVEYLDPRVESPQNLTMQQFVYKDIELVKESDLVFLYMEKSNPTGYGAIWECAVVVENKIPIIAVWEKDYIDPFIACNSLYLYNSLESGVQRLERYLRKECNYGMETIE